MSNADPLISSDWLLNNWAAPDLKIVDATYIPSFQSTQRTGTDAYRDCHIPGAVHFDIDAIADPSGPYAHTVPDPILFSSRVRKLGLGDGHRIVIYDSNKYFASARVWWLFRLMGHNDVLVLDGGLSAWIEAGGDTEDLPPLTAERHFTARKKADLLKDMNQMRELVSSTKKTILDARPKGRFEGTAPEPREGLPSGHLPGSYNVPYSELLTPDGHLKSVEDLQPLLSHHLGKQAVATCGSGVTAAVIALAMARLGDWDVAVYDGSWAEWASHPENPIEVS